MRVFHCFNVTHAPQHQIEKKKKHMLDDELNGFDCVVYPFNVQPLESGRDRLR